MTDQQETSASEEAVIGEAEFTTSFGEQLFLKPWGWTTAKRLVGSMRQMLTVAASAAQGGNLDIASIALSLGDEVTILLAASARDQLGGRLTPADFEDEDRFAYDDVLGLLNAVVRVNFIDRPGARKNLEALLGTVGEMFPGLLEGDASEHTELPEKPKPKRKAKTPSRKP